MTAPQAQGGIVGTGRMGIAICERLADSGFSSLATELAAARDALVDALLPGSTWIDMTTANPAMPEEIAHAARLIAERAHVDFTARPFIASS